jgi:hypothetical protein
VPYLIRQVRRDNVRRRKAKDPIEYFRAGRVFVTCEADEDINSVAELIGENSFVLGSDYLHGDPSRQEDMVAEFRERKDLSLRMVEKMLSDNPKRLYGYRSNWLFNQRGRAATKGRNISRKGAKAAREKMKPNLANLASWREHNLKRL